MPLTPSRIAATGPAVGVGPADVGAGVGVAGGCGRDDESPPHAAASSSVKQSSARDARLGVHPVAVFM
jgi:hypothetical protein